jgi:predicted NBD/HSP70 family sugar kinase
MVLVHNQLDVRQGRRMMLAAQRLLSGGIIVEVGQASGNRGRSPLLYDINSHLGHILGVVLERGHVAVRALDLRGEVICEEQREAGDKDLHSAIVDARYLVASCSRRAHTPRLATAVSVAAPIDPATHTVRQIRDAPFVGTVRAFGPALGLAASEPVLVDNDVNWATLAENRIGSTVGVDDFLYVYLGAGIGAGLFLNGRPYRGVHGTAGEIAFMRLTGDETLIGRLGRSAIGSADGRSIDLQRGHQLLDADADPADTDGILDDLSRAIVNLITATDPGHVVLGGPLASTTRIARDLTARLHAAALAELHIAISPLGQNAPLAGTSIAALEYARHKVA